MKDRFNKLLLQTDREGMEDLIKSMELNGFYTAPCSTQYHLCRPSGLLEHSLNVFNVMDKVSDSLGLDIPKESIIITSLLHDLGKMGQFGKQNYIINKLKSGQVSSSKPYESNKSLLNVPHEIRSIQIASKFIELTEEENFAILYHNGMYSDLKYQLNGKETSLQMLVHFADMWASRELEREVL